MCISVCENLRDNLFFIYVNGPRLKCALVGADHTLVSDRKLVTNASSGSKTRVLFYADIWNSVVGGVTTYECICMPVAITGRCVECMCKRKVTGSKIEVHSSKNRTLKLPRMDTNTERGWH